MVVVDTCVNHLVARVAWLCAVGWGWRAVVLTALGAVEIVARGQAWDSVRARWVGCVPARS